MLRNNVAVWLLLGLGSGARKSTFEWCSSVTLGMVPPEGFAARAALKPRHGYLVANGWITRVAVPVPLLWRFRRLLRPNAVPATTRQSTGSQHPQPGWSLPSGRRVDKTVVSEEPRGPLALPAPQRKVAPDYVRHDPDRLKVWLGLSGTNYDSCWLWQGGLNNSGYSITHYQGTRGLVHHFLYCWATGTPLEELRRQVRHQNMTLDHMCPNVDRADTRCCQPKHLQLVKRAENSKLRWERTRARLRGRPS